MSYRPQTLQERFKELVFPHEKEYTPLFISTLEDCLFGKCKALEREVYNVLTTGNVNKKVIEIKDFYEMPPIFVYPYNKVIDETKKGGYFKITLFVYERLPLYYFVVDRITSIIGKFVYEKIKDLPIVEAYKKSKDFPYVTLTRSIMRHMLPTLKINGNELKDDYEENYDVGEIALESGNYDDELPNLDEIEEFFGIHLNEEQKKQSELDRLIEILNEIDELEEEIDSP